MLTDLAMEENALVAFLFFFSLLCTGGLLMIISILFVRKVFSLLGWQWTEEKDGA